MRHTLNRNTLYLLIFFLFSSASSLDGKTTDIHFRRITINDGLSLSSVYCIYQDSKGFMWFATEDGLNKFDGTNFTVYNHTPGDVNSISYKWIESILEDGDGNLWLGSRHGLTRLDPKTDKVIRYFKDDKTGNSLVNDTIVSLALNGDYLWVGTMNGVNRIHTKTLESEIISLDCDPDLQKVYNFHVDGRKRTWIGTNGGLFVTEPDRKDPRCIEAKLPSGESLHAYTIQSNSDTLWVGTQLGFTKYIITDENRTRFKYPGILVSVKEPVKKIFIDSKDHLWLISETRLLHYNLKDLKEVLETPRLTPSLAINPVRPIIEDVSGNIWLGTFGNGIFRIDAKDQSINHFLYDPADQNSLSDNTVNCLFEDRADGIWVGTFGAGISIYDPYSNLIKSLKHSAYDEKTMSSSFVWSILETFDNKVWIGTNTTGINIYDPENETFEEIVNNPTDPFSLPDGGVREIYETRNGTIWVGTDGGGLSKYNRKTGTFSTFTNDPSDPSSISSNSVRTVFEDSTGILWIGTRNGLNKFNPYTRKFKRFNHDPEDPSTISNNFVYSAIYMDKRGFLWVGTYGGGLNRLNTQTGKFTRFQFDPDDPSTISDNIVFSVYEDEKGYFWIGTNSGLNLFNPSTGKFKRYGLEEGLPNEVIYGIMPDGNNNLWLTTNKGVSRLDLTEFRFKNFDVRDGLQSNEFNGGAFHRGRSGLLYAGGVYGLSIIDPKKIVPVENKAELIISRLEILGKDVRVLQEGMLMDSSDQEQALVEMVENYYLPTHVTYLDVVRLNYKQRFFSIEFAALNHHMPEKLSYRYRMQNLEDHWNFAGSRNYVTYANMKPGSYLFEVEASNSDGFLTENPAQLKIIISPPFWRSYWFLLLMAGVVLLIIVFIYRYLLNQRTNKILTVQNEQIREANNQLQISENNLRELNATKDKFFSIISHDLKNPFSSVLSISELINENFEHTEKEEIRFGVNKIYNTNKHIYELLENLLTWSKTQRGNISVEKVKFNLSSIIETNINILKLAAEKKNISLQFQGTEELFAMADREMISTVFRNLLNNAVKFTPKEKQILITAETNSTMVRVSIEDQGIGISGENLNRLFRIDDKFKTDGTAGEKGTGLGLIICKEFVEQNGGSIDVDSTPGKGSIFSFTVPKA